MAEKEDNRQNLIFIIGLALIFLPWIWMQSMVRVTADAAWLMSAAEHILNGQTLTQYYFDTNPPLCFIIFIPAVLLDKIGFETWQAIHIYTVILSVLSWCLSAYFLKQWPIPKSYQQIILFFYAIGMFCLPFLEYGQKDHLIAIILLPFLLAQLSITYKFGGSKAIILLTLILFAPFILTKPHYGLLPTAVILHRLYERKSLRIIFDADFVILAIGTITYVGATIIFFPDFVKEVLPLSLPLYVNQLGNPDIHKFSMSMMFLAICFTGICACAEKQGSERTLAVFLGVFAALSVIPYWVQWKGFSLHLIPYNIMAAISLGAVLALFQGAFIQKHFRLLLLGMVIISSACLYMIWKNKDDIVHDYYRKHELAEILKPTGNEQSFYIESNSTTTVLQLAEYLKLEFASRFVANWFTFNLIELPKEERLEYWQLLGDYLAQDIERYKPETLLYIETENYYAILNVFEEHENFQNALGNYELDGHYKTDELFMNVAEDDSEPLTNYAIYRRKN